MLTCCIAKLSVEHADIFNQHVLSQTHRRDDLMINTEFAVPVFHAYGHVLECQVCICASIAV